ncbi:MAG: hypothetical protein Q9225_008000 [Loekoesia sp. 1 TL-2023]
MPLKKPTEPKIDNAVASSPLFRISPEIRNIIYNYVLKDSDSRCPLYVSDNHLKRYKGFRPKAKKPNYHCHSCKSKFKSRPDYNNHYKPSAGGQGGHNEKGMPYDMCSGDPHKLPSISTSLLRTCRLIHAEATSLLYQANVFCFDDALTLHNFRWRTSSEVSLVKELKIDITGTTDSWLGYITGASKKAQKWRLCDDFPHLRRLIIKIVNGNLAFIPHLLPDFCSQLGQNITGLDWVHIIGLNNESAITALKPMVCNKRTFDGRADNDTASSQELQTVQVHATEHKRVLSWWNVTLWRGPPASRPPFSTPACLPLGSRLSSSQEYHMQLMLLEQQNKMRLQMARAGSA